MPSLVNRAIKRLSQELLRRTVVVRRPYRAAIVGCGGIAGRHCGSYEEIGVAHVVAVADSAPTALAKALDRWPWVQAYRDYRQMLAEVKPDIVSVCTWPQLHAEMVCEAARAGVKGVMCEKPIALRMDEIEEMVAVCQSFGTKLAVGHQHRFGPVFRRAAKLLQSGKLGPIQRLEGVIFISTQI